MRHCLSVLNFWLAAIGANDLFVFGKEVLPGLPSSYTSEADLIDPALEEMEYIVGNGGPPRKLLVYKEPNVTSFYQAADSCPASQKVKPQFAGFAAKFINLTPDPLSLYWEVKRGGKRSLIQSTKPFSASGTASFPRHHFIFVNQKDEVVESFVMDPSNSVYYHDPYHVPDDPEQTEKNLSVLDPNQRQMYDRLRRTLEFRNIYKNTTGRDYLANYLRSPPRVFMWPANFFGEEHWVTTKETHFTHLPPKEELTETIPRPTIHTPILSEYRNASEQPFLNMTLKVLSCAPRVFEVANFLSPAEVDHLHEMADTVKFRRSSTGGTSLSDEDDTKTRTSFNSWVYRDHSPIVDAIYRRTADLERIDEALMRKRKPDERPDVEEQKSYAEALQLVHYKVGQEYTSHHDFGYTTLNRKGQSVRYSTLLMYLNEPEQGGETTFPRWSNAETFKELAVKPETGKAILFYSQLPDGNLDDLSQHAAKPVILGEKWLINLWFSNPVYVDDE